MGLGPVRTQLLHLVVRCRLRRQIPVGVNLRPSSKDLADIGFWRMKGDPATEVARAANARRCACSPT